MKDATRSERYLKLRFNAAVRIPMPNNKKADLIIGDRFPLLIPSSIMLRMMLGTNNDNAVVESKINKFSTISKEYGFIKFRSLIKCFI